MAQHQMCKSPVKYVKSTNSEMKDDKRGIRTIHGIA